MTETRDDRLIGLQFGDYRLKRLIASGGMARIYEGDDVKLGRSVAVKVLNLEGNANTTIAVRFQREAKAIAKLEHDHIVSVYSYGEAAGCAYIAMRLIDGRDLSQEISRNRRSGQKMEPARALAILEQIADAIDFAHSKGIIHRDIKPSNILIDKRERAYLTDFGLLLHEDSETSKTRGTAFGTPRYIAPEQALASQNAVPQSDVYALAVILYEILTGEAPFSGETPMEIALGHIGDPPRPPRSLNPKIPHGVERELLRALEKEPARRHATASEFIRAVKSAYAREQPKAGIVEPAEVVAEPASKPKSKPKAKVPDTAPAIELPQGDTVPKPEEAPRKRRFAWWPFLLLLVLAIGAWVVFSQQPAQPVVSGAAGDEIVLHYDQDSLVIQNATTRDIDFFSSQFIRGAEGGEDDFSGDRVRPNNIIPAGYCFALFERGTDETLPAACLGRSGWEVLLGANRFFWRREPLDAASFQIWYNRVVIAECPTLAEGDEAQTCSFAWQTPVPTSTSTPAA